jgi:hypothetical protein
MYRQRSLDDLPGLLAKHAESFLPLEITIDGSTLRIISPPTATLGSVIRSSAAKAGLLTAPIAGLVWVFLRAWVLLSAAAAFAVIFTLIVRHTLRTTRSKTTTLDRETRQLTGKTLEHDDYVEQCTDRDVIAYRPVAQGRPNAIGRYARIKVHILLQQWNGYTRTLLTLERSTETMAGTRQIAAAIAAWFGIPLETHDVVELKPDAPRAPASQPNASRTNAGPDIYDHVQSMEDRFGEGGSVRARGTTTNAVVDLLSLFD